MKKDLLIHLIFTIAFMALVSFVRHWLAFPYYPLWIGGLVGMLLPDIDYLIYIYALKPKKEVSLEAAGLIEKKSFASLKETWDLLTKTRTEHTDLIFHTAYFQVIFLLFTFLMITSTGSLFGIGVVLAFTLHLLIDQASDLFERGSINNWFAKMNLTLNLTQEKWYLLANTVLLLLFGLVF